MSTCSACSTRRVAGALRSQNSLECCICFSLMLVSLSSFVFSQANGGVVPWLNVVDGAFLMTQQPVRCVAGVDDNRDALLINLALPTYLDVHACSGDRRETDIVCHIW